MTEQSKVNYPEKESLGKAKFESKTEALRLLKANPDSPLKDAYLKMYTCAEVRKVTTTEKGVMHSTTHCSYRFCPICARSKMGLRIRKYMPAFEAMKDPYFVTLTKPTVDGDHLKQSYLLMVSAWNAITKKPEYKRRGPDGIRKVECKTSKNIPGHYHLHFHLLVDGRSNAEWFVSVWLEQMKGISVVDAQDSRPADKGSLLELFKYFNKEFVGQDDENKRPDYRRLDLMYRVLKGKQTIRTIGKIKAVDETITSEIENESEKLLTQIEKQIAEQELADDNKKAAHQDSVVYYNYNLRKHDYFNKDGERYSGFNPDNVKTRTGAIWGGYRARFEFRNNSEPLPTSERLEQAEMLSRWPEHEDTAQNGVGTAGKQP